MFKKAKKHMSMMEIPKKQLNVYKYFTQSGKKMFNIPETMHTHSHICQMYANTSLHVHIIYIHVHMHTNIHTTDRRCAHVQSAMDAHNTFVFPYLDHLFHLICNNNRNYWPTG